MVCGIVDKCVKLFTGRFKPVLDGSAGVLNLKANRGLDSLVKFLPVFFNVFVFISHIHSGHSRLRYGNLRRIGPVKRSGCHEPLRMMNEHFVLADVIRNKFWSLNIHLSFNIEIIELNMI